MGEHASEQSSDAQSTEERRRWMAILARSGSAQLYAATGHGTGLPVYRVLRGPENGLVMLRGRAGGSGAAFNLGEVSVTRCTVRTEQGYVGHAYVAGRDLRHAELAAALDAALQDPATRPPLLATVVEPLAAEQHAARRTAARKAAATKVEFFTMGNMR